MADFAIQTAFEAKDRGISSSFNRWSHFARRFGSTAEKSFNQASRSGSRFGDIVGGILAAGIVQRGAYAIYNFAKSSVKLASDLTEVQNVIDTTFGKDAADINAWSKAAMTQYGLSELSAKRYAGSLGAMMKSSGLAGEDVLRMSKGLVGLAGDFASFYNLPTDQAFEKIRSGISGETEPLKQLGINMSVANMEAYALSVGITKAWRTMNQAEQTQLRYNYLMKVSKDAQGDFAKTLTTSMANQQRVLSTNIDQVSSRIMSGLVPVLTNAMMKANAAISSLDVEGISKGVNRGIDTMVGYAKSLYEIMKIFWPVMYGVYKVFEFLAPVLPVVVGGMVAYNLAIKAQMACGAIVYFLRFARVFVIMAKAKGIATAAQWAFNAAVSANPITLVIIAIVALIAVGVLLYKHWDLIKQKFFEWTAVFDNPVFATLGLMLAPFITIPILIIRNWDFLKQKFFEFFALFDNPIFSAIGMILFPFLTIPILIARNWEKVVATVKNAIDIAGNAASAVGGFFGMGDAAKEAPNAQQARAKAQNIDFRGELNFRNAPPGTTFNSTTSGAPAVAVSGLGLN